jgi:hypothetical protein
MFAVESPRTWITTVLTGTGRVLQSWSVKTIASEKVSTRAKARPELEAAVKLARDVRGSGAAVTLVVHERKRLGRGIDLATLAEQACC